MSCKSGFWTILVGPLCKTRYGTTRLHVSIHFDTSRLPIRVRTLAHSAIDTSKRIKPTIVVTRYPVLGLFLTVINLYPFTRSKPNHKKKRNPKNNNANVCNNTCIVALSRPILAYWSGFWIIIYNTNAARPTSTMVNHKQPSNIVFSDKTFPFGAHTFGACCEAGAAGACEGVGAGLGACSGVFFLKNGSTIEQKK